MRTPIAPLIFSVAFALLGSPASGHEEDSVARGAYLVNILGCGSCHTEGSLIGSVLTGPHLAGSKIGIAYTDHEYPAVVFPANLTPDPETGIGGRSREQIYAAMTQGESLGGHGDLSIMPWLNYGRLMEADIYAIADYLLSLPPVSFPVPEAVPEGTPSDELYIHFGVYRYAPDEADER